jgi:hypothetical protein
MRASGLVTYGIISASGVVLRNDPGGQLGLPVRLQPGERTSVRLAIRVPAGQIVRSGSYKDLVDLDLFDRDGRRMDNTKSLPTELRVAARTQINVSGAASSFGSSAGAGQVHFEQLTPGANRRLFVQLWSNSSAKVSVKSENQGRLVNRALGPQAVIPYSLVIDGERADLVRGSKLRRRPPITLDGASYEVRLQIEPFGASFAGTYRDTITLTVEPEE